MSDPFQLDESVVADLSAALAEGRRVRFAPNVEPSASLEAADPMGQPAATFLGTKVDEIESLVNRGFEVNVHPDGSIFAFTPDRSQRYLAAPEADLDEIERAFVRDAIRSGHTVVVEPDGSIAYQQTVGASPPSSEVAAQRIAHFDQQVDSGALTAATQQGKSFEVAADGTMSYVTADTTASATSAVDNDLGLDVLPDGDELRAEAAEAAGIAKQIREVSYDRLAEETTTLGLARDEAARKAWSLDQEAKAADMQVKRELATVDRFREHQKLWEPDAAGDDIFAQEAAERVNHARALGDAAQARADAATARAAELRQQAADATTEVTRLEAELDGAHDDYQQLATEARSIETRASLLETAADLEDQADAARDRAEVLRSAGDEAGATAAEEEASRLQESARENVEVGRSGEYDDDVLGEAGVVLPEGFEHGVAAEPAVETPSETDVPTKVIDFEPEVIEVVVPKVIDFEPYEIEVDTPSASEPTFDDEIDQLEQFEDTAGDIIDQ